MNERCLLVWQKSYPSFILAIRVPERISEGREGICSWDWHRFADHAYRCQWGRDPSILKTQFLLPSRRYRDGGFSLAQGAKPQLWLKRLPCLIRASVSKEKGCLQNLQPSWISGTSPGEEEHYSSLLHEFEEKMMLPFGGLWPQSRLSQWEGRDFKVPLERFRSVGMPWFRKIPQQTLKLEPSCSNGGYDEVWFATDFWDYCERFYLKHTFTRCLLSSCKPFVLNVVGVVGVWSRRK